MLSTGIPLSIYTTKTPIDMWRCNLNNYVTDRYQLSYFFVSNSSMHRQLLGYLLGFLLCRYVSLRSEFRVVFPVTISALKRSSVRRYHQLFVGGIMSYVRYMCLLADNGVQCILCFVFLRFVYPMLPFSLDCQFVFVSSVLYITFMSTIIRKKNDFLYDNLNKSYTYVTEIS